MENEVKKLEPKRIKIPQIKRLLTEGYTRYERQNKVEDGFGYGSIETFFGLTAGDVKDIFKHPMLKGLKTKVPTYILVDEPEDDEDEDEVEIELVDEEEDDENDEDSGLASRVVFDSSKSSYNGKLSDQEATALMNMM